MIKIIMTETPSLLDWDNFVRSHPSATPFHLSAYFSALESSFNFKHLFLIASLDNKIIGVLPLTIFRSLTGKVSLNTLPFCDSCNCLAIDEHTKEALINKAIAISNKYDHWQYKFTEESITSNTKALTNNCKVRMVLNLQEKPQAMWDSISGKVRNQIRKAEKNKLTFEINSKNSIDDFYAVYSQNMKSLGSPPHCITLFKNLKNNFKDNMQVIVIKHENKAIAAGVGLYINNTFIIPWASSLREYNHLNANMFLYWQLIKTAIKRNCQVFDFGRSTFNENTYKFKKQWGAQPIKLQWQTSLNNKMTPMTYHSTSNKRMQFAVALWAKMPLSLTIFLGTKIRKYISL